MTASDAAALRALFEPAWEAVRASSPRVGWGLRMTPVFPEPWPAPTEVVVFAYAAGLAIGVSDGENTSGPFAVAHLRAENVLAYYRHWLGVCGVIAGALPESQQRFFTAVRSGGARA